MKRTLVLFLLAAAALSAACSDDGNTAPEGQGRLRIVHVSPDAPNLDVVLDGDTVASDIAYLGSSDYLELSAAGPVDIYVTDPGTDLTLTSPVASNVAFEQALPYVEAIAGTYQVRVTPTGTKDVIIDSGALTLENGQVRTVIAVEAVGGGEPFDFLVLNDLN